MTRVLLVEDDQALARGVIALLRESGFAVDHVANGEQALELEPLAPYGVAILDIGLPDMSGFDILKTMRRRGSRTPVLILTARDGLEDRVSGLDMGADDYLLKPFEPAELEARVRAVARRGRGASTPIITLAELSLNSSTGEVRIGERRLDLRRRELSVLSALMNSPGHVVPRERLSAEVFDYDDLVAPNALELYVARLRKKLGPNGPQIRTIRGLGYVIDVA